MNLSAFFSSSLAQAIGWTLIHSLWIGLLAFCLVKAVLCFVSLKASAARYTIALAGLGLIVLGSIGVFVQLYKPVLPQAQQASVFTMPILQQVSSELQIQESSWLYTCIQVVQSNMNMVVALWFVGMLAFSLRVVGGSLYVSFLRKDSVQIGDEWHQLVQELGHSLSISRMVSLAQSTRVQAPIVLGYFKPLIILPAGMLSGLSTEQIETILLHELAHIKRHDYLINLLQMVLESIFFFNPFVWMVSTIIRNEREHCCDDVVVSKWGQAATYASALVQLEEARLGQAGIALSLAENKNQLFNRIKRLMEKSVKNYSGRERIIPVVLLVLGLMCASWVTISQKKEKGKDTGKASTIRDLVIEADTIIHINGGEKKTWRKVVTIDEDGNVLEEQHVGMPEPPEPFEPYEPVAFAMEPLAPIAFPNIAIAVEPLAPLNVDYSIVLDSLPTPPVAFQYDENMDAFAAEFEKSFKEKFSDFYAMHEKDMDKMMEDLKTRFEYDGKWADAEMFKAQNEKMKAEMQDIKAQQQFIFQAQKEAQEISKQDMKRAKLAAEQAQLHADNFKTQKDEMEHMRDKMRAQQDEFRMMEKNLKKMDESLKQFDNALKKQLVKDGYVKSEKDVQTINWREDTIEINGEKIKPADVEKYQELHRKYFNDEKSKGLKRIE
jgi:beta-lactamase regulating signal transducer with metallopeptidase domain